MALICTRAVAVARPGCSARSTIAAVRPAGAAPVVRQRARSVVARAEAEDFDAVLAKLADKFEKTDNKPIVVAYIAAAGFAIITAEWLIHLPALNVLLGFPVQLLGLLVLPVLGVRWFVDGQSAGKDVEDAVSNIVSKLPGLDKK